LRFIALTVIASCLLIAGAARAQTPKDAQSSYEPRSTPGSGQKYLEKFAGDWDVSKVFYPRSGEPVRISGQCRQTMIQGGRFLQSDFVFGQEEKKSTGLGIIGFEPESGRFTSFWVDSRQTRMSARQSREPFDGEKIVLYSLVLEPNGKETRRSRTVSQLDQNGRRLLHRQYALGTGGEERLMMELIMTRKP
jgi:Protein of unknown function (DUF1579)